MFIFVVENEMRFSFEYKKELKQKLSFNSSIIEIGPFLQIARQTFDMGLWFGFSFERQRREQQEKERE